MRGFFSSFVQLFLNIGILILYGVSATPGLQYYYIAIVAIAIVVVFEVLAIYLRESPSWLFSKCKQEKAVAVLQWLRGRNVSIAEELNELEDILSKRKSYSQALKMFSRRSLLFPLLLTITFSFFVITSGVSVFVVFAGPLFAEVGESNPNLAAFYSVGISSIIGTLAAMPVVDRAGRKPLLIIGGLGMLCGSVMMGTHFYITRPSLCINSTSSYGNITFSNSSDLGLEAAVNSCNEQYLPIAIIALITHKFFFNFSWGPIQWILYSEFFPLQVRGVSNSIGTFTNWLLAGIVGGAYLSYNETVNSWFAMWTFSLSTLIGIIFITVFIPETKGKTLQKIQKNFERKYHN